MARRTRREMIRTLADRAFIGRVDVLQSFRANVSVDEPTRMLFALSGEGGVGKTSLLDQLQRVGDELDVPVLAIRCDDRQPFPVEVIARAAECFGEVVPKAPGLKNLTAQLDRYEKLRRDIEADDDAPDLVRMLVSPVVSGGVRVAKQVPGVGLAAGVVDADKVGVAAGELASYLRRRVRNENEVRLVREPERVLTPLFLEVVNGLGAAGRRVVLFCDVFERTGGHLERWLWQILRSDHGDFDPLFIVVVAGRDELGQAFTEFGDAVAFVQLQPFTERETELYLAQRGVDDPELVRVIYRDTGGLPVLVELVASQRPQPGQPLPDVSGDAVERFLSWVDDPQRRTVCQHAAVPRWFDAELLALSEVSLSGTRWLLVCLAGFGGAVGWICRRTDCLFGPGPVQSVASWG